VLNKVLKNPKKSLKKKTLHKSFPEKCVKCTYVLGYFSIIISSLWINIRGGRRGRRSRKLKWKKIPAGENVYVLNIMASA
jgi:hypothetical protein